MGVFSKIMGLFVSEVAEEVGKKTITNSVVRPAGKVAMGVVAGGGLYGYKKWNDYSEKERQTIINSLAPLGLNTDEANNFARIFQEAAKGDESDLYTATKSYLEGKGEKENLKKWEVFAKSWVVENEARKKNPVQGVIKDIQTFFSDPKSFGAGSLLGALGLGALGAWLGGGEMWLTVPLAIIGGLAGQPLFSQFLPDVGKTTSTTPVKQQQQGTGSPAVNPPAQSPAIVPPRTPPDPRNQQQQGQKAQTPGASP